MRLSIASLLLAIPACATGGAPGKDISPPNSSVPGALDSAGNGPVVGGASASATSSSPMADGGASACPAPSARPQTSENNPSTSPLDPGPSSDEAAREKAMASHLYRDPDYRQFVCGEGSACDEPTFRQGLDFSHDLISERPPIVGYFVAPKRYGENFYTGLFVVRHGHLVPLFTFFGSGIGPSDRVPRRNGVKGLLATERVGGTEWRDSVYEWNGTRYVETKSTVRKTKPSD